MTKSSITQKIIAFTAKFEDRTGGMAVLMKSIGGVTKQVDTLNKSMEKANIRLDKFGRAMTQRSRDIAKGFSKHSESLLLPSLGGLAATGFSLMSPAHLEREKYKLDVLGKSLDNINGKVAKLKITEQDVDELFKHARKIGAATQYTSTEAMQAMNETASHGWNDKASLFQALEPTMFLTGAARLKTEHFSLFDGAKALTNTINSFDMERKVAPTIADKYAYAISNSAQSMEQAAAAMGKFASLGKVLNLEFDEALAVLMTLADRSTYAEEAGTALKSLTARIAYPPAEMRRVLAKFTDGQLQTIMGKDGVFKKNGLTNFFKLLASGLKTKKIIPGDVMAAMGLDSGGHLIGGLADAEHIIDRIEALHKHTQGTAKSLNNSILQGSLGQNELLMSGISEIGNKLGFEGGLLTKATKALESFTIEVERFNTALTPGTAKAFALVIEGLCKLSILVLGFRLLKAGAAFLFLPQMLKFLPKVLKVLGPFFAGILPMAIKVLGLAFSKFGLVATAILALGTFVYQNSKNFAVIFKPLTDTLTAAMDEIGAFFEGFGATVSNAFKAIADKLTRAATWLDIKPMPLGDEMDPILIEPKVIETGIKSLSDWLNSFEYIKKVRELKWVMPWDSGATDNTKVNSSAELSSAVKSLSQRNRSEQSSVKVELSFKDVPRGTKIDVANPARVPIDTYTGWAMELS